MDLKLVALLSVTAFFQISYSFSDYYIGAVVEYNPTNSSALLKNVKNYIEFIEKAKAKQADIVVFPENGLTMISLMTIPDPAESVSPCESYKDSKINDVALKNISCAARDNKIYVVVNVPELRTVSDKTGQNRTLKFNTNVVFDRAGTVVARYTKFNLFDEFGTSKMDKPDMSFFTTDFGVTFGVFTCFDILFQEPTLRLVQQYGITDFVFTSHWFSELPFLTALQVQQGWAQANKVNLLASGYNNPRRGSTGSGIFNGEFGPLVHSMGKKSESKLLVAAVPKISKSFCTSWDSTFFSVKSDDAVENYRNVVSTDYADEEFALLSDHVTLFDSKVIAVGSDFEYVLCSYNDFCCNFEVRMDKVAEDDRGYMYRAVAFNGVRKFGLTATGGTQLCGVILCRGPHITNCTMSVPDISEVFEISKIKITGNFLPQNSFQFPSTLIQAEQLDTLPTKKYRFTAKENDNFKAVSIELLWPVNNLQTFAIWGRDFIRDGEKPSLPLSKASPPASITTLFLASAIAFIVSL